MSLIRRRARSVNEYLRDLRASKAAQRDYRFRAAEIAELADVMTGVADTAQAREFQRLAFIAANAARAEFFDPEPRA
jgi:hypothetical protein